MKVSLLCVKRKIYLKRLYALSPLLTIIVVPPWVRMSVFSTFSTNLFLPRNVFLLWRRSPQRWRLHSLSPKRATGHWLTAPLVPFCVAGFFLNPGFVFPAPHPTYPKPLPYCRWLFFLFCFFVCFVFFLKKKCTIFFLAFFSPLLFFLIIHCSCSCQRDTLHCFF